MKPKLPTDDALRALMAPMVRRRTRFVASAAPAGDPRVATRFGGRPSALPGEPWPMCECGAPLVFLGQVSGADAPSPPAWFGLATIFWCTRCRRTEGHQRFDVTERAWHGWCVRVYPEVAPGELTLLDLPDLGFLEEPDPAAAEAAFVVPEGHVGAVAERSLPEWISFCHVVPETRAMFDAQRGDDNRGQLLIAQVARVAAELTGSSGLPDRCSALGGFPHWLTGSDTTPACRSCRRPMDLFVQLGGEPLAERFFEAGMMWIFTCSAHRDECALLARWR
jgi:hypothetical protein